MKLGIMQPYFFPYVGYFSLIKNTDKWIVFDTVQFITHGWIERNRILKPSEGWQYIGVPLVKHPRETLIKDVKVRNNEAWKEKIFRQIDHYKKKAPFYNDVVQLLSDCFKYEADNIRDLDVKYLELLCHYLGIKFEYEIFSEMNLEIDPVEGPGDWALNISKALNAKEYINPPGGIEIFDKTKFDDAGIKLSFLKANIIPYNQRRDKYEEGLSILDVMMFNDPKSIMLMLDQYELIK